MHHALASQTQTVFGTTALTRVTDCSSSIVYCLQFYKHSPYINYVLTHLYGCETGGYPYGECKCHQYENTLIRDVPEMGKSGPKHELGR